MAVMNKRALMILTNVENLHRQAADALQVLLDNPDDFEVTLEEEKALRAKVEELLKPVVG
jgi:hypothetical protein